MIKNENIDEITQIINNSFKGGYIMPIDITNILIKKRVDLNSNINIDEQILQIAIYDEFKAYETYSKNN